MREYEPILIRPLTLRGVFGITWKVFRRRLGALTGYNLLYFLLLFVAVGLCVLPMLQPLLNFDYSRNSASEWAVLRLLGGSFSSILLLLLCSLFLSLLVVPIYNGTLYGELSARIYGSASSLGLMLKRSKHSLKRFFTLTLCYMLVAYGIGIVVNIVTGMFSGITTLFAMLGALPGALSGNAFQASTAMVAPMVIVALIALAIELAGMVFLQFVYPVAVNEPVKNFAAVKRSFELAWKRYGRVLSCELIFAGISFGLLLLPLVGILLAVGAANMTFLYVNLAFFLLFYLVYCLFGPVYGAALATVLYFDTRTRVEGTAWLGEPEQPVTGEPFAQVKEPAWQDPVWQDPVWQDPQGQEPGPQEEPGQGKAE